MVRKTMLYQMSAILGLFFLDLKEFAKVSCYKRIIREKLAKAIWNLIIREKDAKEIFLTTEQKMLNY